MPHAHAIEFKKWAIACPGSEKNLIGSAWIGLYAFYGEKEKHDARYHVDFFW